jgi:TusA-related sulfurtransferase
MKVDEKLDLCGVLGPYCLLLCKSALASMTPGDVLEARLRDPDVIEDMLIVLKRSGDILLKREQLEDHTCLWIQRGTPPTTTPEQERRDEQ